MTLISSDPSSRYKFGWCYGYNFNSISSIISDANVTRQRLCYLSTEIYRIYLMYSKSPVGNNFSWVPYQYRDHQWEVLPYRLRRTQPVKPEELLTESSLVKAMQFQMALQWRDSMEGYYYNQPSYEEVKRALSTYATTDTLEFLKLRYYEVSVEEDPEWEGAVQVLCAEGYILYPYRKSTAGSQRILLTQYATFVPESRVEDLARKGSDFLNKLESLFNNLNWSDIRFKLSGGKHAH